MMKIGIKKGSKLLLITALVGLMVLVAGVGYALAQEGNSPGSDPDRSPEPGRGPGKHMMAGEVIKVENNTVTLKTRGGEEKSVKVDDQTDYRKPPDGQASLTDVKPGEKIGIKLKEPGDGGELTARVILIGESPQGPGPRGKLRGHAALGEVTAVNGDTVTVTTSQGDKQFKLPAIAQGSRIGVIATEDGSVRGILYDPPENPQRPAS